MFPRLDLFFRKVGAIVIVTALVAGLPAPRTGLAQSQADAIVASMTPRQRVGQLFIVPPLESYERAAELVRSMEIGGVVLDETAILARADDAEAVGINTLVAGLRSAPDESADEIPAFVILDALRGGAAARGLAGMTPIPSAMAIGATWRTEHASAVGAIRGRELANAGFDMLLGPSLDVLREPRPESSGDLGPRVFGGDPAWVGRLGSAYVEGIHVGSGGRVAVAAGNFPGIGAADRSLTEELPIVDRSLEELLAVELRPFEELIDTAQGVERLVEGLVTTHVRYPALQQQTDRPLSLDGSGLSGLQLPLTSLGPWRQSGGIFVSAGLGLPAVRRYVDPELTGFSVRRVVLEALLAGNDLLMLTDLGPDPSGGLSEVERIEDVVEWLAAEYQQDEAVREAVDAALGRVISLKLRLHPEWLSGATGQPEPLPPSGSEGEVIAAVARDALTKLSPTGGAQPRGTRPTSPQPGDQLLFVVDARPGRHALDPARFVDITLARYGPDGRGTARLQGAEDVGAITFAELGAWLTVQDSENGGDILGSDPAVSANRVVEIGDWIDRATWIVFAMRDVRPNVAPGSDALKRFLGTSRAESVDRQVIAFAFDAPYHLDTTEIAKLTALYGLYSPIDPFVDVAVRAVFGDVTAAGASPVSVPGVGYDLPQRLRPDPRQVVTIEIVGLDPDDSLQRGANFTLRTSAILDSNGHRVPDDTQVTFRTYDRAEGVYLPDAVSTTDDGIATVTLASERTGMLEVTAELENGLKSAPLINAIGDTSAYPPSAPEALMPALAPLLVDWGILLLCLTLMMIGGMIVFGADIGEARTPSRRLRLFLLSLAFGLAGYLLAVVGGLRLSQLPGNVRLWPAEWHPVYQAPVLSALFALIPIAPTLFRALLAAWRSGRTAR